MMRTILYRRMFASLMVAWSIGAAQADVLLESPRSGVMQLYRMSDDGQHLTPLTQGPRDNTNGVWSPDGQRIAFVSTREGLPAVYLMRADGGDQHRVSIRGGISGNPAWSPDGRQLAFTVFHGDHAGIMVLDLPTRHQRMVNPTRIEAGYVGWTPDGRHIVYTESVAGQRNSNQLRRLDPTTGESQLLVDGRKAVVSGPSWSPDGKAFVYTRSAGRDGVNIEMAAADGTLIRRLTEGKLLSHNPQWSPDGRWIAYESNAHTGERMDIFVAAAEGTTPARNVTDHPQEDFDMQWSPDGQSLWFTSFRDGYSHVYRVPLDGAVQRVGKDQQYLARAQPRPRPPARLALNSTPAPGASSTRNQGVNP